MVVDLGMRGGIRPAAAAAAGSRRPTSSTPRSPPRPARRWPARSRRTPASCGCVSAAVLAAVAVYGLRALRRRPARPRGAAPAGRGLYLRFLALTSINPVTVAYFAALIAGLPAVASAPVEAKLVFVAAAGARLAELAARARRRGRRAAPPAAGVGARLHRRSRATRSCSPSRSGWRSPRSLRRMAFRTLRISELDPIDVAGVHWLPAPPHARRAGVRRERLPRRRRRAGDRGAHRGGQRPRGDVRRAARARALHARRRGRRRAGRHGRVPARPADAAGRATPRRTARSCSRSAASRARRTRRRRGSGASARRRSSARGELERAEAILLEGLAAHPGDGGTLYDLACVDALAGRHEAAAERLRAAVAARAGGRAGGRSRTRTSRRCASAPSGRCDGRRHRRRPRQRVGAGRRPGRRARARRAARSWTWATRSTGRWTRSGPPTACSRSARSPCAATTTG